MNVQLRAMTHVPALVLAVALLSFGVAAPASADVGTVSISGTVQGAGSPNVLLDFTTVTAYRPDGTYVGSTETDFDGYYVFEGLPAGAFKLKFETTYNYITQWWRGRSSLASATAFRLAAGESTVKNVVLKVGGCISGVLEGEGTPRVPLDWTSVTAVRSTGAEYWAETSDGGQYVLCGLPTGTYKLRFDAGPYVEYASQWWSAKCWKRPSYFRVVAGQIVTGKNGVLKLIS